MFDRVLTLLLMLGLLTCPVRCALGSSGGGETASQAAACSCCQQDAAAGDRDLSGGEGPQPAENDCGCQDCLCDGAISEVSGSRDLAGDLTAEWMVVDLVNPALLMDRFALSSADAALGSRDAFAGWCFSGRQARIVHQSFLI